MRIVVLGCAALLLQLMQHDNVPHDNLLLKLIGDVERDSSRPVEEVA